MRLSQVLLLCFSAGLCAASGGGGHSGPSAGAIIPGNDRDDDQDDGSGLPAKKKPPPPAKQANLAPAAGQSNDMLDDPNGLGSDQVGPGNGAPAGGQLGDEVSQEPMMPPSKGQPGARGAAKQSIPPQQGAGSAGAASDAGLDEAPLGGPSNVGSSAPRGAANPRIPPQQGAGSAGAAPNANLDEVPLTQPSNGGSGAPGGAAKPRIPPQQGAGSAGAAPNADLDEDPLVPPSNGGSGAPGGAAKQSIPPQQGAGSAGATSGAGPGEAPVVPPNNGGSGAARGAAKPRIPAQKGAGSGEGVTDAELEKLGPVVTPGKGKPGYLGTGMPAQQGAGGAALPADLGDEDPSLAGGTGGALPADGAAADGGAMGDEAAGDMGDGAAEGDPEGAPAKPKEPYKFAPPDHVVPCQLSFGPRHGCGQCSDDLSQKPGEIDKAPFKEFNNDDYGSDEPGIRSGYLAWFSIPDPPRGCKTVVMVPTDNAQPAVGTVGVTIISAGKAGCYSGVFHHSGWATANCCGQDQCNLVAAGALTTRPIKKRESRLTRRQTTSSELDDLESLKADTHKRQAEHHNNLEKRFRFKENADKPSEANQPDCFPPNKTEATAIQRAGTQQVNETDFKCTVNGAGACRAETGVTSTSTNSTMITNGETNSKSKGNSVGVTAGIQGFYPMGIGPTLSVTDTISQEVSQAIEKSLAKTDENGKTESWSFIQDMTDGTMGRISWVPYLECFGYTMQCKDGIKEFEHCRSKGPKEGYTLLIYTG